MYDLESEYVNRALEFMKKILFSHENICCRYSLEAPLSLMLLMSTHYIYFHGEMRKIFLAYWVSISSKYGVVGWCEGAVYLTSLGRPTDIGLQLGKACYPCSG